MASYGHLSRSLSQLLHVMSLLRLLTKHPFLRPNSQAVSLAPCRHLSILFMAFILRSYDIDQALECHELVLAMLPVSAAGTQSVLGSSNL